MPIKRIDRGGRQSCNRDIIDHLLAAPVRDSLTDILAGNFFLAIGLAGELHAQTSWSLPGLDRSRQAATGHAMQRLLERVDRHAEDNDVGNMKGFITVHDDAVGFSLFEDNERV